MAHVPCEEHVDHGNHCRDCVPHDVPKGTTVVCAHGEVHHPHEDPDAPRHVVVSSGWAPLAPIDMNGE